jgi:chromosomal replication initiator protein
MKLDELVPKADEMIVPKKVLRDCDFHVEDDKVTVFCTNPAEASYLELVFKRQLLRFFQDEKGKTLALEIIHNYPVPSVGKSMKTQGILTGTAGLNDAYTFDTFIAGESNKVALAAAMSVVGAKPYQTTSPNFLYIYGTLGTGKTHLLQSIIHALLEQGKRVAFFNSSEFADHILPGMDIGGEHYLEKIRLFHDSDVLAIDDMRFIRTMPRVQRELKGILDHLIGAGKVGLFTGVELPVDKDMELFPELASRLMAGMVTEIKPPDKHLLRNILQIQFSQRKIVLQPEVFEYLANVEFQTIRNVITVANTIANKIMVESEAITVSKVQATLHALKIITPVTPENRITKLMDEINVTIPMKELQETRVSLEVRIMRENIIMALLKTKKVRQVDVARAFKLKQSYVSKIVSRHK